MAMIARDYDNVRLTGFVREVPQRTEAILSNWLPEVNVGTRTYKIRSVDRTNDSAVYRAFDAPSTVVAREGYTEKVGAIPPMSEIMIIGEDERLGIYERAIRGDFDDEVEGEIYNDAARMVRRIRNRLEIAKGQLLQTGTVTISENGLVGLVADFDLPAGNSTTSSGSWSNPATDIIGDIRTVQEQSRDDNGTDIASILLSSQQITNLLRNTGIQALLSSNGVNPSLVTETSVNQLLVAHGLPTFVRYDYKVNGVATILSTNAIFLPPPDAEEFGRCEFGTTAEALELQLSRSDAPGLVGLVMREEDPVSVMTKVAALAMPVLTDARKLYVLDVT